MVATRQKRLGIPIGLILAGALFAAYAVLSPEGRSASAISNCSVTHDANDSEELAFLGLINAYRQQNGLGSLTISSNLNRAAAWMVEDLATNNYFSHTDSLGRSPYARAIDCGYPSGAGENLAAGTVWSTAQAAMDAWKASPGHNANMLGTYYQQIGIARFYSAGSQYGWYWATTFGATNDGTGGGGGGNPTATPTRTPTQAPPTSTPTRPAPTSTATPVPPTSTPTSQAPTSTPSGPTNTPTPTSPAPTSTPTSAATTPATPPPPPGSPSATNTPTPTSTATPAATATPSPTATPTATSAPAAPTVPGTSLPLAPGANLVAWPSGTASTQAVFGSSTTVSVVYEWDPATGNWKRYFPGLPAFLNNLTTLQQGKAYWVISRSRANLELSW